MWHKHQSNSMILLAFTRVIDAYYYLEIQNFDDEES